MMVSSWVSSSWSQVYDARWTRHHHHLDHHLGHDHGLHGHDHDHVRPDRFHLLGSHRRTFQTKY